MTTTICLAQLNPVTGDLQGNAQKIIAAAQKAHATGAALMLTPEMSLCGYMADDLFLRPAFVAACAEALQSIARQTAHLDGLHIVVGHPGAAHDDTAAPSPAHAGRRSLNMASVVLEGQILTQYAKRQLPNSDVFDEARFFRPGHGDCLLNIGGMQVALLICEDAWSGQTAQQARQAGAQLLAVINASPFHINRQAQRLQHMTSLVRACGLPLLYVNTAGGHDELVFDGNSFALQSSGNLVAQARGFDEDLLYLRLRKVYDAPWLEPHPASAPPAAIPPGALAVIWQALMTGLRDYVEKNGFKSVVLGLSGGLDSALVLTLAVDALGPQRVRAVMMPSPYTADISLADAHELCQRLGVSQYGRIPITPLTQAFETALEGSLDGPAAGLTAENIQARVRGVLLMAISNQSGALLLATGNKSELATGYCTLYGDMAGGYAPIKDVFKTDVCALARWRNLCTDKLAGGVNPIVQRIIDRPPSAELRPGQTDQDSLPPYDVLDAILARYMEEDESIDSIVAAGFGRDIVEKIAHLLRISEYKRRQAPAGTRITQRAFGKDWRYPLGNRFLG